MDINTHAWSRAEKGIQRSSIKLFIFVGYEDKQEYQQTYTSNTTTW